MRRRGDIIQCFKIIKGLDDIPCERFFLLLLNQELEVIVINRSNQDVNPVLGSEAFLSRL